MDSDNALPVAAQSAEAGEQSHAETSTEQNGLEAVAGEDAGASTEGEQGEPKAKPEKTPEQREIERLRRAVDRKTRQLYELRGSQPQRVAETPRQEIGTTSATQGSDEKLTLSQAELDKMVTERAEKIAPTLRQQQAEIEHRQAVVQSLEKEWGRDKFNTLSSDLDDVFSGLADQSGRPKPATAAIFESEMPAALIEYLTDPDNADEAEALSHMGDRQAARKIAQLEAKLAEAKKTAKPQRSNAPAPLEPVKGGGKSTGSMPDPSNTKAYIAWANKQERGR